MSKTIWKTRDEEMLERGIAVGEIMNCRQNIRVLLEEQFGTLPEALVQQIESIDDLERLRSGLRQVLHLKQLEDLKL